MGSEEAASRSWSTLTQKSELDLETLGDGEYRLLPAAWKRLRALGISDPLDAKLRGIYRQAWFLNQIHADSLQSVCRLFSRAAIDVMVSKGLALSLFYFEDFGMRPMDDVDIIVRSADFDRALATLKSDGWTVSAPFKEADSDIHAIELRKGVMHAIDLHRRATSLEAVSPDAERIWKSAEPKTIRGAAFFIPSPAELFLQTCVHAMTLGPVSGIRWIPDAFKIIERRADDVLRGRPWLLAQERGVTVLLSAAVRHLLDHYQRDACLAVIDQELSGIRAEPFELHELRLLESAPKTVRFYHQKLNWYSYIRRCRRTKRRETARGFLKYYRNLWGDPSLPRLASLLVKKCIHNLRA